MLYRGPKTAGGWLKNRKTAAHKTRASLAANRYHFILPRHMRLFLRRLIGFVAPSSK